MIRKENLKKTESGFVQSIKIWNLQIGALKRKGYAYAHTLTVIK
ncbi:hypothetical protein FDUTEX481_08401 [Tolypothrix sp. PCC 7601]|nr:hypothetical protein FDUTEX481_08401 [Tolypothrix sp. PCC 7601]